MPGPGVFGRFQRKTERNSCPSYTDISLQALSRQWFSFWCGISATWSPTFWCRPYWAIIGKPLTDLLSGLHVRRTRFPRSLAALCTLLAIWVVVVGVFWLFVPIVFQKIREFSSLDVPQIIQSFQEPLMSLESFIRRVFSISESEFSLVDAISEQIKPLLDIGVINNLALVDRYDGRRYGIAAFSISFITFFFLKESHLFTDMVVIMFPKKYEPNITRALDSVTHLLIRYFTGIVAESSIMTLIVSLGLLMLGFRFITRS